MKAFIRVMKALSDPNRVKIIKMLSRRQLCVCELQEALGIAQPTVSKHLRILEEAGLVDKEKEGLWINYKLADGSNSPYAATMLGNLKHWLDDDPEIKELLNKVPHLDRNAICARNKSNQRGGKNNGN
ncbi:MAG: winged helix-turn-helix transcriptional regulator [Deltaproteobacteria bacterium]|nr:winged helix-turn-helix transcriptional regulator [Deltaproteobacteria bacterium]MBW2068950.1 winged helix-turn-helix transcriptional regulator [Deltaproteobacteria bacterium]